MNDAIAAVRKRRIFYLGIGFLGMFCIGIIYGWSILKVPIAKELSYSGDALSLAYTLSISFFCIGCILSAVLCKRIPLRFVLMGSAVLILGGYGLMATLTGSVILLYLFYSVMVSLGIGLSYNSLIAAVNSWFPDKKGLSAGVLMMGFGLSVMFLGRLMSRMFALTNFGWQRTLLLLGMLIFLVLLFSSFLIRKPTSQDVLPSACKKAAASDGAFGLHAFTFGEAIRRPSFWLFYFYGLSAASVGSTVIGFARELTLSLGAVETLAITLVGVLSLCNGLGRIVCGMLYDVLGRKKTMVAASVVTVGAAGLLLTAIALHSLKLGVIGLCLAGVSYGCVPTISAAFISSAYGMKDYALIYGVSNTKLLFSSVSATVCGVLLTQTGAYIAPFALLLGISLLSLVINLLIRKP